MNKKGQALNQLSALAIAGATIAIVLVVGFVVLAQLNAQRVTIEGVTAAANSSYAANATNEVTAALATIPTWIALIFLVSIGGILIFLVARGFGNRS